MKRKDVIKELQRKCESLNNSLSYRFNEGEAYMLAAYQECLKLLLGDRG